ncbi:SRPBCC family protein [Candidatus Nitrosotalea sp. TS]
MEIDASPEVVFKAISDPSELTNWFPGCGNIRTQSWREN